MLYDPGEHRQLVGESWSESAALHAIEQITRDAAGAYRGPEKLWPNAPEDLDGEADEPFRNAYFGAAGVAWSLDHLARHGVAGDFRDGRELAQRLHHDFLLAPELTSLAPPPAASLLFGESGILLAAQAILGDGSALPALEAAIGRNVDHPSLELCWGSPGTMIAALSLWRATGEARWHDLWLESAKRLLSEWRELVWTQDLYGKTQQYVGAGHGFAGTAFALLSGRDLLGRGAEVLARARHTLIELALVDGACAQWFPLSGTVDGRHPVQWCHGAPGMVISLADLPHDDETDRLLRAGGELTWKAGPLSKGPGLCHGTAGNAYAFLSLFARSNDELWLERARAFAMDAVADLRRRRHERGRGRYSLYTGDLGVAMLLHDCLTGSHQFPFLDGALTSSRVGTRLTRGLIEAGTRSPRSDA